MADAQVEAFAQYVAGITEDTERARVFAQVKTLAAKAAPEEAFKAPIRTLEEYLAAPIEVPPTLIHPAHTVRGGLNATIGRAGKGKTVMALNRNLRWSAGLPMFDGWKDQDGRAFLAPEEPLRILIVENEGAAGMFHRQIGVMCHADGFLTEEERKLTKENTLIWGEGGYSSLKLDDPQKLNGLRRGIEEHKPDIVFIEPFRSLWAGEENSSTEMQVVVDALIGVATDYNCGVHVSHHESKGGEFHEEAMSRARGSTVLEGAVTLMENFMGVKGGDQRELSWSKARYQDPDRPFPAPVRMEWVPETWTYRWVPVSEVEEAIMQVVRDNGGEPISLAGIAESLDEKATKLRNVVNRLAKDGKLRKLPSVAGPGGSTGNLYKLPAEHEPDHGGLSI